MLNVKCAYDFCNNLTDVTLSTKYHSIFLSKMSEKELFELEAQLGKVEQEIAKFRRANYEDKGME